MKRSLIEFFIIIVLAAGIIFGSPFYMPGFLSRVAGKRLHAQSKIARASIDLKRGIIAEDITLTSSKGLRCTVENALIILSRRTFFALAKERRLFFSLKLKNVRFQSPGATVLGSITEALGFKQLDSLLFDTAKGEFYFKRGEVVLKDVEVAGRHAVIFANGTIRNDNLINCSLKILLSDEFLGSVPEPTRKFFFKEGESTSKVELYLSGDIERPAINFSTDLFKLSIR